MRAIRSPLILGAVPAGLILGAVTWMSFSAGKPLLAQLQAVEADFNALDLRSRAATGPDPMFDVIAFPLFAAAARDSASPEPSVRLEGVAITPSRKAALISINSGPAEWMVLGASKDGVSVRQVDPSKVVVDTPSGTHDITLGESSAPPAAQGMVGAAPNAPATSVSGFRLPSPPASAPRVRP